MMTTLHIHLPLNLPHARAVCARQLTEFRPELPGLHDAERDLKS